MTNSEPRVTFADAAVQAHIRRMADLMGTIAARTLREQPAIYDTEAYLQGILYGFGMRMVADIRREDIRPDGLN